jgi:subtilase family serine protease
VPGTPPLWNLSPDAGASSEFALDIEMAMTMAPKAKIVLIQGDNIDNMLAYGLKLFENGAPEVPGGLPDMNQVSQSIATNIDVSAVNLVKL